MVPINYVERFKWDKQLSKSLRYHLKKKGVTLQKISDLSNGELSMSYLLKLSSAKMSTISRKDLQIICDILKIQITELIDSVEISKILTE
jgi:DNA-binding Xre family transcriptional regulator